MICPALNMEKLFTMTVLSQTPYISHSHRLSHSTTPAFFPISLSPQLFITFLSSQTVTLMWMRGCNSSATSAMRLFRLGLSKLYNHPLAWASEGYFQGGTNSGFFPGGGQKYFSRVTNSREISFYQLETKRKMVFYWKVERKITNFKIMGCLGPTLPPHDAHVPQKGKAGCENVCVGSLVVPPPSPPRHTTVYCSPCRNERMHSLHRRLRRQGGIQGERSIASCDQRTSHCVTRCFRGIPYWRNRRFVGEWIALHVHVSSNLCFSSLNKLPTSGPTGRMFGLRWAGVYEKAPREHPLCGRMIDAMCIGLISRNW